MEVIDDDQYLRANPDPCHGHVLHGGHCRRAGLRLSVPIQKGPILITTSQPALPQHTHTFRRLKALTGLSVTRLAEILGVERRTLFISGTKENRSALLTKTIWKPS